MEAKRFIAEGILRKGFSREENCYVPPFFSSPFLSPLPPPFSLFSLVGAIKTLVHRNFKPHLRFVHREGRVCERGSK